MSNWQIDTKKVDRWLAQRETTPDMRDKSMFTYQRKLANREKRVQKMRVTQRKRLAKLTPAMAQSIIRMRETGAKYAQIGSRFHISTHHAWAVVNGKKWRDLKNNPCNSQ